MAYYSVSAAAIRRNIQKIKDHAGEKTVWAVLKGNGYGIGLLSLATICRAEGLTHFAVTESADAVTLRQSGTAQEEVLLLTPQQNAETLRSLCRHDVICTVASQQDAMALADAARAETMRARAHLKIDTGMGRYGFLPDQLDEILSCYEYLAHIDFCGIYTHFAASFCSKSFTHLQAERFTMVCDAIRAKGYEVGHVHAGNSAALFRCLDACQDGVRVGSALLGRLPFRTDLEKVGVCRVEPTEVRWLPKGATCGYGRAFRASKPIRIAVLPIGWYNGYATEIGADTFRIRDCLRRALGALKSLFFPRRLYAVVGKQKCRVLGHVGMCHTTIDVTKAHLSPDAMAELELNPTRLRDIPVRIEE